MRNPLVSVIIPTFNSQRYFKKTLQSLANQTYKKIEVLVVDKGSADQTKEIVHNFKDKLSNLYFYTAGTERTSQFNFGVSKAKGEILYYIGSDYELDPKVVEKAVVLVEEGFDAVIIEQDSVGESFWAKVRRLERSTYVGDDFIEASRFFTRKIYQQVGGYDSELVAYEEHDLQNRLKQAGARITRTQGVVEHHLGEPDNLGQIIKKSFYYGTTVEKYFKKHRAMGLRHASLIRPSYFRHWRRLVANPVLLAGLLVMTFSKQAAGGAGYLFAKVRK
jgi:glycosyltransferase involved in cell wall biosynthesis